MKIQSQELVLRFLLQCLILSRPSKYLTLERKATLKISVIISWLDLRLQRSGGKGSKQRTKSCFPLTLDVHTMWSPISVLCCHMFRSDSTLRL